MSRTIDYNISAGISPNKFINIKVFRNDDIAKGVPISMNWKSRIAELKNGPATQDEVYQIVVYYDREYIANIDTTVNNYNNHRISSYNKYHDPTKD